MREKVVNPFYIKLFLGICIFVYLCFSFSLLTVFFWDWTEKNRVEFLLTLLLILVTCFISCLPLTEEIPFLIEADDKVEKQRKGNSELKEEVELLKESLELQRKAKELVKKGAKIRKKGFF